MLTTNLRKIGSSVMLTVPPAILEMLHLQAGDTVGITVEGSRLIVEPKHCPRHTMADLLASSDYSQPRSLEDREWIDAPLIGGELP